MAEQEVAGGEGPPGAPQAGLVALADAVAVQLEVIRQQRHDLWHPDGLGPAGRLPVGVLPRVGQLRQSCDELARLANEFVAPGCLRELNQRRIDGVMLAERLRIHSRLRVPRVLRTPHPAGGGERTQADEAVAGEYMAEHAALLALLGPLRRAPNPEEGRAQGVVGPAPRRVLTDREVEQQVTEYCLRQVGGGRDIVNLTRDGISAATGCAGGRVSQTRAWNLVRTLKRLDAEQRRAVRDRTPEELRRLIGMEPRAQEAALTLLIAEQARDIGREGFAAEADDDL